MNWNPFKRNKEDRSCGCQDLNYINPNLVNNRIDFGSYQTSSSMNLACVFRAVDIISDSIAALPIEVLNKKKEDVNNNISLLFDNHYLLMKLLVQSVLLKGNGFCFIERAADGTPVGLRFLQSSDVQITYRKEKNELYYTAPIITNKRILPKDIIHLRKYSYDGVNGISVISFASRSIGIADATEQSAKNYFKNGGHLTGILCATGHTTQEQRESAKESFINNMSAGNISVLPKEFQYSPIQMSVEDAQLLQSRQFSVVDISRFFGISPILLGDLTHSSMGSIEEVQTEFYLHTLAPFISMIEDELNLKLGNEKVDILFNEDGILRTDKKTQAEYYTSLVSGGILTVNEVRKELGFGEIEGADSLVIPYTDITQNTINNGNNKEEDNKKEDSGDTEEGGEGLQS